MTVALPMTRSLVSQLLARSARSLTRPVANPLLRVDCDCTTYNHVGSLSGYGRTYATAAAKPASRPKQHTGRAPARKTTTRTTTKKTTTATKKAPGRPKKKATKKAAKKPAAPKAKRVPSKAATLLRARKQNADLKTAALLDTPKNLPQTVFQLLVSEEVKKASGSGNAGVSAGAKTASARYKNLTLEERERYNHEANQNKAKNEQAYKRWVQSHSPLAIKLANNARRVLNKKAKAAGQKKHHSPIKDDRRVHSPSNAYTYFSKDRNASGDLSGMTIAERGKLVGQEWKALSAAQRKPYQDEATKDRNRYLEEHKTVYGEDAAVLSRKSATAA